ncbi:hypothetical protein GCM10023093_07590 [Nemorincola caseinilytica]|uniref:T9SS C-terminal target domain-containing protein n=1 Tax=Nemorincola caseinilytica TaxID=2054315 RepID=A0ABP8N918_9BACT
MKRLLSLFLLVAAAVPSFSQTATFSLPVTPCNNDGVLTAIFTGLTPPLTVQWTTMGTTGTTITHSGVMGMTDGLTGYSGGPVYITAYDGTSMASNYYPGTPPLTYTLTSTPNICPALGSVSGTASGGTAPYTFQWYDRSTGSVVASGATASLPEGDYGVIVTDAAGCTFGSRYISDTGGSIGYVGYTATVTATPANCTDGTATVVAVGASAVPPLSYLWNTGATTPGITGLTTGSYQVEITDALGCRATTDYGSIMSIYDSLNVFVPQTTVISVPSTITPATCTSSDGAIATFPSGGTAPYTYSWSNGATTGSQTGLTAGFYYLTVTDANGCIGTSGMSVTAATPILITASSSPSLCTSSTGNASIIITGGTAPYSTTWYTTPVQTSPTATLLPPGTYGFQVTDAVGCVTTGAVTVAPINIITGAFTSTSPLCALSNGTINVTPAGGAAPYTYLWSTGATTATLGSVPQGSYSVRITDNMGCKKNLSYYLPSYSPVGVGLSTTDATCIFNNDGSIIATPFGGTAPYSYGWSTGGTAATITGVGTGHYSIHVTDASGCTASNHAFLNYDHTNTSCYCTIEGTIYNDANANCTQDAGENGINHIQVHCTGIGYTYTDAAGHYSFIVPSGSYTVTETVQSYYPLSPCQTNGIPVLVAASTACVHTINFANAAVPVHNLRISTSSLVPPVPGNVYKQRVVVVNEGTVTEDSIQSSYRHFGQLLLPTFTPSSVYAPVTGVPYNYMSPALGFPSLAPGTSQDFVLNYNVPTTIPLGTVVNFRDSVGWNSPVSTWLADNTPANNVAQHAAIVVASYDPNYKEVTPRGTGANGIIYANDTVLEYTVHFQNLGTWYAQDVVVLDTLDSDVDWTTLHPVYESAPCKISLYTAGTQKVAKFTFNNINLPPQMFDDLRSNGMFTYTVRVNPGIAVGTQIRNRASIYFDYNEPVITNWTLNTLGSTGGPSVVNNTPQATANTLTVYPNPAGDVFHVVVNTEKGGATTMIITDVTGKTMLNKTVTLAPGTQAIATDIRNFSAGIYFVNVHVDGASYTQKLVVVK